MLILEGGGDGGMLGTLLCAVFCQSRTLEKRKHAKCFKPGRLSRRTWSDSCGKNKNGNILMQRKLTGLGKHVDGVRPEFRGNCHVEERPLLPDLGQWRRGEGGGGEGQDESWVKSMVLCPCPSETGKNMSRSQVVKDPEQSMGHTKDW